jgi:hypothetical protein
MYQQNLSDSSKKKNILYVSKYCLWSTKFQEALQKTPMHSKFIKVFIDTPGVQYPSFLERVPTIQIYDENEKRHILTDKHAFEWLNQKIDTPVDLSAYNDGEMGSSISDCFAFLDKNQESSHSFMYLDAVDKFWITTPDAEKHPGGQQQQQQQPSFEGFGDTGGSSKFDDSSSQALEAFKRQRDSDVPQAPRGPTPQMEDQFKKQNGINQDVDHISGQHLESQVGLLNGRRQNEIKRAPLPKHAPNFQTGRFKSDMFQSHSGTGYQPAGIGVHVAPGSSFDKLRDERESQVNYQQAPANMERPDFKISANTYQKMRPGGIFAQQQAPQMMQRPPQQMQQMQRPPPQQMMQQQRPQQQMMQQRPQGPPQQMMQQRPQGPPQQMMQQRPPPQQMMQQRPPPQQMMQQRPPPQQMMQQRPQGPPPQQMMQQQRPQHSGPSYSQQYSTMPQQSGPAAMFVGMQAGGGQGGSYAKII